MAGQDLLGENQAWNLPAKKGSLGSGQPLSPAGDEEGFSPGDVFRKYGIKRSESRQTDSQVSEGVWYSLSILIDWGREETKWSSDNAGTCRQSVSMQQGSNQWIRIRELGKIRHIPAYREDEFGLYNKAEVQWCQVKCLDRADWQPKVAKSYRFELAVWTEYPQPRQRLWVGRLWPHLIYWAPYLLIINLSNSSLCYAIGEYVRDFNLALLFLLRRDH